MKVLLGHLDWGLGTKSPHSDPADYTFLGLCIVSNVSKWPNILLKNGVKISVAGSCTISISISRHFSCLLHFCPCLDVGLFMSYLCDYVIISIFIFTEITSFLHVICTLFLDDNVDK